ncbi:MAG: sorbosone dehydrogenase [Flavipsychrobacter sp.]|nr:sorbosone dehydrogenase [Flavipsychrobacter sp.]
MNLRYPPVLLAVLCMGFLNAACQNKTLEKVEDPRLNDIKLPDGFSISIFADNVENARSLALGANGTVFVGTRNAGKVYALVDADKDGVAETRYTIADGLNMPNGVAFRFTSLYIAELDKIWRIDNIEANLASPPERVLVNDSFPSDKHHGWKYIAFGPDDKLYVPVGAPCNVCDNAEQDPRYASITRMNPDGTGFEVFASGIRNTVGFAWHPVSKELWFTDNGADNMGENNPGDELNMASRAGMHFGFPYCHQGDVKDKTYGDRHACSEFAVPVAKLSAHTAALGMKFYTGKMFPAKYKNSILIAEHGSWNRKDPIGYRVMFVKLKGNLVESYEPFAEGWLKAGTAWGRPVDILQLKDGSILVSDDHANAVYRISYNK